MSDYKDWYSQLLSRNDIRPEELFEDKSQVITAGPGCGKTSILSLKAVYVLEQMKNRPQGIACLTYSRKLAREIKNKLHTAGVVDGRNIFIGTLHGFCLANLVSLYGNFHNYKVPNPLRIASENDCQQFWDEAKATTKVAGVDINTLKNFRNTVYLEKKIISSFTDDDKNLEKYARVVRTYEKILIKKGVWDFELIIRASIKLLYSEAYISELLSSRFAWLFIDEYQDLGFPLHLFTKLLIEKSEIKIFTVADPDQCIYKFQGSDPKYFKELQNNIPTLRLMNNYRSTAIVCDAANAVLNRKTDQVIIHKERPGRVYLLNCQGLFHQQCEVGERIIKLLIDNQVKPGQITVLTRYRKHDMQKEFSLPGIYEIKSSLGDIPHKVLSNPFYNDYTAFISWLQDLADWCSFGHKNGEILFSDLFNDWLNLYECDEVQESEDNRLILQEKFLKTIQNLCDPSKNLRIWFKELEGNFYPDNFFEKLEKFRPDDIEQYRQIADLVQIGGILEKTSIQEFSTRIFKDDEVVLNTLHGSKGSQNHIIIIIGGEFIKDPNLFYVGVTRAKFATFILYTGKVKSCENIASYLESKEEFKSFKLLPSDDVHLDIDFFSDWEKYNRNDNIPTN